MQSPFDMMAATYDGNFTNTAIGQLQRQQVWESLTAVLKSYQRPVKILEINCGTGEDALELSRSGHYVTATDGSSMMIEVARQKADLAGAGNIEFAVCTFDQIDDHFNGKKFDLVISNFGGLNCINGNEIEKLGHQLYPLLHNDGKLFFVIMGRSCLWEIMYYLGRGKPATAFRRKRRSVLFEIEGVTMPVFYYSPSDLKKIFRSLYTYCRSKPVGLFIPPSYLQNKFGNRKQLLSNLTRLEKKFSGCSVFSNLADHFCIIFQKNETV